jgi:hypothetical protein
VVVVVSSQSTTRLCGVPLRNHFSNRAESKTLKTNH